MKKFNYNNKQMLSSFYLDPQTQQFPKTAAKINTFQFRSESIH